MSFTISRAPFLRALASVAGTVEKATTIPILSHLHLKAAAGWLTLTGSDLERWVTVRVEAAVMKPVDTTVSAHLLHAVVRTLPDGAEIAVAMAAKGQQLEIRCLKSRFTLPVLDAGDYPDLKEEGFSHAFTVPGVELKRLLDKTRYAISTEETRYYLNGVYLHAAKGAHGSVLRAVATDGHRLARVDTDLPPEAEGMPEVIVPRKSVHDLTRLLDASTETVALAVSPKRMRFAIGHLTYTTKLIDGQFPAYEKVFPPPARGTVAVGIGALRAAIARVSTCASERGHGAHIEAKDGRLSLVLSSKDGRHAEEEIEVDYEGGKVGAGFNVRYLDTVGQTFDGEDMQIAFVDGGTPVLISDPSDRTQVHLIMPMKV